MEIISWEEAYFKTSVYKYTDNFYHQVRDLFLLFANICKAG